MLKRFLLPALLLAGLQGITQKISYEVSFPNIVHHEAQIKLIVSGAKQDGFVFRMSRSSPGRYATHEFGKNVYAVKATDQAGKILDVKRTDGDVYEVAGKHDYIALEYTLYANYADGTYAGIDASSVHLNTPATFMWVKGFDNLPVAVNFALPANSSWTIATQLKQGNTPTNFTAPNFQYFMDSPIKIGNLITKDWALKNPDGKSYQFKLALEADATDNEAQSFAEKVKRITQEAQAVYGEVPAYDYGSYTFLASINPYVFGDGMEHRNSTMITMPGKFNSQRLPGVFSHEFFHCWNVERIRPKSLEPFNFEKSNMSNCLWFAEGFTQYYGELLMLRAGMSDENSFANNLAGIINTKENRPGSARYSPAEMSCHAVFVDAGAAVDKSNYVNMYSSYYPYGAAIALALDMELRSRFNLTLDDYMKAAWIKFGKTEIPYTIASLQELLATVTKDARFASEFFSNYVTGHQSINYNQLLAKAGFEVTIAKPGVAWMGNLDFTKDSSLAITSNTIIGTPAYDAGIDIGDQLLQLDGTTLKGESSLNNILAQHKPGDKLTVVYAHRGQSKTADIVLAENPRLTVIPFEKSGKTVNSEIQAFRKKWLNSQTSK